MNPSYQKVKKCIFCEGKPLTKEHLWSDWLGKLIPQIYEPIRIEYQFKTADPASRKRQTRPGHTITKKIRAVCQECNNGWMSRLENSAKPILSPLVKGENVILNKENALILSQWIALKTIVSEHESSHEWVTPYEDRTKFMTNLCIPKNFKIWVARCGTGGWESSYVRTASTGTTLHIPPFFLEKLNKNIQSITFGLGHLLVYVIHTTLPHLPLEMPKERGLFFRLHPFSNDINWPPLNALSTEEATRLSHSLNNVLRSFIK